MRTAYLVGFVDVETCTMTRVGIYSEPHPTVCDTKPCVTVVLGSETHEKYVEARTWLTARNRELLSLLGPR